MALKLLTLICFVSLSVGALAALGFYRAKLENARIIGDHILGGQPVVALDLRPQVYADLPAPVQRYFDFAFNGQTSITLRSVEWDQTGDFMLPVVGQFYADGHQINRPNTPVYAFTGWFWRFGLPLIESRDAFLLDSHDMRAKLLGWKTVMHTDYTDATEVNSLHSYLVLRYYGQAPLMPWALLPNEFVAWEANDDASAYLHLTVDGLAGRYLVHFGDRGEITSMKGDRLLMEGNGAMQREVGLKTDYQEINGFMVPTRLEYRWFDEDEVLISRFNSQISDMRVNP